MRIKLFATDVDGTLTESRDSFRLNLRAIEALRRLEEHDIVVSLVTGNGYEIAAGLARYIGVSGPVVAENGCLLFENGRLESLCLGRPPGKLVDAMLSLGLKESWQNRCRLHDLAFVAEDKSLLRKAAESARRIMSELGWRGRVMVSGYALHLQPEGGGKGRALRLIVEKLGTSPDEVVAVGDSEGDLELLEAAGIPAAVGDADPRLKIVARMIASSPAGDGLAEIVGALL